MRDFIRLALVLLEQATVQRGRDAAARIAYGAVFGIAAAGCGIAAIACGLAAVWIYAVPRVGAVGAPLVVAGILGLMCLGVLVAMRQIMKRPRPPAAAGVTPAMLQVEATRLVKHHKGTVLIAAVLAGLVAGMNQK